MFNLIFKLSCNIFLAFGHNVLFPVETSSAIFEMGNTKVIAAVYGPREVLYNYSPYLLSVYFEDE